MRLSRSGESGNGIFWRGLEGFGGSGRFFFGAVYCLGMTRGV